MKIKHVILALGILLLCLTACGKQSELPKSNNPTPIQKPDAGKATVTGRVISTITSKPLKTAVWLAEVHRQGDQGVYVLNATTSPGIFADENGIFVLANVEALEYVIVVGDPEGKNEIINDETGQPKVWNIAADQIYDVGNLKVALTK